MTKTESIIADIYDAWRAQDLDWFASYLPEDFRYVMHLPRSIHPLGGTTEGKAVSIERLRLIAVQFDVLRFDTSDLMIQKDRAAVEIPVRYRHRETGAELETTIANFWTFEEGWPVRLVEYHDVERIKAFVDDLASRLPS